MLNEKVKSIKASSSQREKSVNAKNNTPIKPTNKQQIAAENNISKNQQEPSSPTSSDKSIEEIAVIETPNPN